MPDFIKKFLSKSAISVEHPGDTASAEEDYCQAAEYHKNGNYEGALKLYLLAANQGHAKAQFNLGGLYFQGLGVDKNDREAFGWFKKSAGQGNVLAQINLAEMYRAGHGVDKSENGAIKWFRKAAEQGNPNGQTNLGLACKTGIGTEQSDSEAVSWFRKAAEQDDYEVFQGIAAAQYNLGLMCFLGRGVAKSDGEALFWFREAADHGLLEAREYIEKLENIIEAENQIHGVLEKLTSAIEGGSETDIDSLFDDVESLSAQINMMGDDESDNCPGCLSDAIKMDSEEDHVFARILEDLVRSRSFGDTPDFGANDGSSLIGTNDWSPSMSMAYGYAMRVASAALYVQGIHTEEDYLSAKVVFTGLQLQTDQSVEFQDKAVNEAIKFIAEYVDNFDLLFVQSIIGTAEKSDPIPGTIMDDDEFFRNFEEGRKELQPVNHPLDGLHNSQYSEKAEPVSSAELDQEGDNWRRQREIICELKELSNSDFAKETKLICSSIKNTPRDTISFDVLMSQDEMDIVNDLISELGALRNNDLVCTSVRHYEQREVESDNDSNHDCSTEAQEDVLGPDTLFPAGSELNWEEVYLSDNWEPVVEPEGARAGDVSVNRGEVNMSLLKNIFKSKGKYSEGDFSSNWSDSSKNKLNTIIALYEDEEFFSSLIMAQTMGRTTPDLIMKMGEMKKLALEICEKEGVPEKEFEIYIQGIIDKIMCE